MTWRRFLVLVRGLSSTSATVTALARSGQDRGDDQVNVVEGTKNTQSAFVALFGRAVSGRRGRRS